MLQSNHTTALTPESVTVSSVFESSNYRNFVRECLGRSDTQKRSGSIKKLADHLKCHSTYISQVINEKAHFSNEQALAFCKFYLLSEDETEFFINLLNRDRAGNKDTCEYFTSLIKRQLDGRNSMTKRWALTNHLDLEQSIQYYSTWIPQAVHMATQIDNLQTPAAIASALGISIEKAAETLKVLESIGIVKVIDKKYESIVDCIHLEKSSPLRARVLANWRHKVIEDLTHGKDPNGINYSSAVSLSEETYNKIKNLIYQQLEEARGLILDSKSEKICVYNIDFTPLLSPI